MGTTCSCIRNKKSFIKNTNKYMSLDVKLKKKIFKFLEFNKEILYVILPDKKTRKELQIEGYNNNFTKIMTFLKITKFNCLNNIFENFNQIFNDLMKFFKLELISFSAAIFLLSLRSHSDNVNEYDMILNLNNDTDLSKFYEHFVVIYFYISSIIFSLKNPFYFQIVLNNDKFKIVDDFIQLIISNDNNKYLIDLIICENFSYSSLNKLSSSNQNILINSLTIEKSSMYVFGLNMIENKFQQISGLKYLTVEENTNLKEEDKNEAEIYDKINLDNLKNILNFNKDSLIEIIINTNLFINIASDEFLNSILDCKNITKIFLNCKISKINLEILKKLLKLNLNYFDINLSLIKKEELIEIEKIKILYDFMKNENIHVFPFSKRLMELYYINY